jgi:hypothetical protein
MAEFKLTPTELGAMIDDIERIREELFVIQNVLQKMEVRPADASTKNSRVIKID